RIRAPRRHDAARVDGERRLLIGLGPLFGLASAISWGTGDFAGGLASRYASVPLAMIASQAFGVGATTILLLLSGEAVPGTAALAWAAAAGLFGMFGLACFYRALSGGTMALIAPIAGVVGAALPAAFALLTGDHVSPA